jgi:hypothetical protein
MTEPHRLLTVNDSTGRPLVSVLLRIDRPGLEASALPYTVATEVVASQRQTRLLEALAGLLGLAHAEHAQRPQDSVSAPPPAASPTPRLGASAGRKRER